MMLARKVVTRSGRKVRGLFPSKKLKRMVQWESLLERDAILLFEFSAGILNYREQPALIQYFDEESDSHKRYFPDFEIIKSSEEIVHLEVKPQRILVTPEISNKLNKVTAHYSKSSLKYGILTEIEIRREPLHSNLKLLFRYLHKPIGFESIRRQVLRKLESKSLTFSQLSESFDESSILKMLSVGALSCDLDIPIQETTIFHSKEAEDDQILF